MTKLFGFLERHTEHHLLRSSHLKDEEPGQNRDNKFGYVRFIFF